MNLKHKIPFEFILDHLYPKKVKIKPMFGCFGLYVDGKMVFFLRYKTEKTELNGVWIATTTDNSASLSETLPSVNRDLKLVEGKKSSGTWLLISIEDENFEAVVIKACELIIQGDSRIGKITKSSLTSVELPAENDS